MLKWGRIIEELNLFLTKRNGMKVKFIGWIHGYYLAILLLVAGFIVYGGRYFILNGQRMPSVYEATVRFDKLDKEGRFSDIENSINLVRSEEVFRIIAFLDKEAKFLNSVIPSESYKDLGLHLNKLNEDLGKLPSSEQLSSLQRTFYQKVSNLEKLADENGWGELERISRRLSVKIQGSEFFGLSNVSRLLKSIDKDMKSVNKAIGKRPILKTVNFDKEMELLSQYANGLKSIGLQWIETDKSYSNWKREISPEISLRKINLTKVVKNVFWGTAALLGFILLAFVGGLFVGKTLEKSIRKRFELFTKKIIKDGLFPAERKIDVKLSPSFETDFENLREYFHKRLGFGAMVQKTMPFPILLLDSNLNLLWANKLFYDKWNLDKNEIPLSWDYLAQFTDLKGSNPVSEALKGEVAGIYNIKIFAGPSNKDKGEPVEMYVRSANYGKKKRVMVLFYPLGSLEATWTDKTKDIVRPVVKTLDTLEKGGYTPGFKQAIAKDFTEAGIGDIFDNFHSHYNFLQGQRNELDSEIAKVENILNEQYKLASEFKMLLKSDEEVIVQSLQAFSRFKTSLINIIGMRERLEEACRQSVYMAQDILKENEEVLKGSKQMFEKINKNKEIFQSLVHIGTRLKEVREPEELSKNVQLLNITLSKAAMLLEGNETLEVGPSVRKIRQAGDFFQEVMENLNRMGEEFRRGDDMMVSCLKEFYASFKGFQTNMVEMGHFAGRLDDLNKNYTTTSTVE